ncbi:MAG: glycosyltransferase family 39 protein [bacterium]
MFNKIRTITGKHLGVILLLLIVFSALVIRIVAIANAGDYWFDERATLIITDNPIGEVWRYALLDVHPPLYYLLIHLWGSVFGFSAFVVRLFSVIFGSVTVIIVYFLGRDIFNKQVGLIGALLFAVSPYAIDYSSEARMYGIGFFLSATSTYLLWKLCVGTRHKNFVIISYLFTVTLSLYTHIFFIISALGQILFLIIKRKTVNNFKTIFIVLFLSFLVFSPWIISFMQSRIYEVKENSIGDGWFFQEPSAIPAIIQIFPKLLSDSRNQVVYYIWYIVSAVLFFVGITLRKADEGVLSNEQKPDGALLMACIIISSVILSIFITVPVERYYFYIAPFYCLIVARGINRMVSANISATIKGVVVFFIVTLLLFSRTNSNYSAWNKISEYIVNAANTQGATILQPHTLIMKNYYPSEYKNFITVGPASHLSDEKEWILRHNWKWYSSSVTNYEEENMLFEKQISAQLSIDYNYVFYPMQSFSLRGKMIKKILEKNGYHCCGVTYFPSKRDSISVLTMGKFCVVDDRRCAAY